MSTKLDTTLCKCREIFKTEKTKFLDALSDFIEANRTKILTSNTLWFVMRCEGITGTQRRTDYKFDFSSNLHNWETSVTVGISEADAISILENEFNAIISETVVSKATGQLGYHIDLPFNTIN